MQQSVCVIYKESYIFCKEPYSMNFYTLYHVLASASLGLPRWYIKRTLLMQESVLCHSQRALYILQRALWNEFLHTLLRVCTCFTWTSQVIYKKNCIYATKCPVSFIKKCINNPMSWISAHITELRHISLNFGTYHWISAHITEFRHISLNFGTYHWISAHITEFRHISLRVCICFAWSSQVIQKKSPCIQQRALCHQKRVLFNLKRALCNLQIALCKWKSAHFTASRHFLHNGFPSDAKIEPCVFYKMPYVLYKKSLLIWKESYGVATFSRIDKIIGLFCKILFFYRSLLQKRPTIYRSY